MLKCVTCTFDQHFFHSSLMRTITEPSTFWPFKRVPFNHQGPIWSCFVRVILSQPLFFFSNSFRIIYEISTVNVFSLKLPVSTHNFTEYGLEISLQFYVEHQKNTLLNVDC